MLLAITQHFKQEKPPKYNLWKYVYINVIIKIICGQLCLVNQKVSECVLSSQPGLETWPTQKPDFLV